MNLKSFRKKDEASVFVYNSLLNRNHFTTFPITIFATFQPQK